MGLTAVGTEFLPGRMGSFQDGRWGWVYESVNETDAAELYAHR